MDRLSLEDKVDLILKTVTKTDNDLRLLTDKVDSLQLENNELKVKVSKLEDKLNLIEKETKQNSLVFYGVNEQEQESEPQIEELIINLTKSKMNVNITGRDIDRAFRLGANHGRKRPIVIQFASIKNRNIILQKSFLLRSSGYAVAPFYTAREQSDRLKLSEFLKKARLTDAQARINKNKLVFNTKLLSLDECDKVFNRDAIVAGRYQYQDTITVASASAEQGLSVETNLGTKLAGTQRETRKLRSASSSSTK